MREGLSYRNLLKKVRLELKSTSPHLTVLAERLGLSTVYVTTSFCFFKKKKNKKRRSSELRQRSSWLTTARVGK
jgi:hypothetical protein